MGSAFGIAIATSVFNSYTSPLFDGLGVPNVPEIFVAGQQGSLQEALREQAREIISDGYNRQMLVMCAFAAAEIPVGFLIWRTKQIITA